MKIHITLECERCANKLNYEAESSDDHSLNYLIRQAGFIQSDLTKQYLCSSCASKEIKLKKCWENEIKKFKENKDALLI